MKKTKSDSEKPVTRENKENFTAPKTLQQPKRNNLLLSGERNRTKEEITRAKKIISGNHGTFSDDYEGLQQRTHSSQPKSKEERSGSPSRNSNRDNSLSKRNFRGHSVDNEEEKLAERNNKTATQKVRALVSPEKQFKTMAQAKTTSKKGEKPILNQKANLSTAGLNLLTNDKSPIAKAQRQLLVPSTQNITASMNIPPFHTTTINNSRPNSHANPWNSQFSLDKRKKSKGQNRYDSPQDEHPNGNKTPNPKLHTIQDASKPKLPNEPKMLKKNVSANIEYHPDDDHKFQSHSSGKKPKDLPTFTFSSNQNHQPHHQHFPSSQDHFQNQNLNQPRVGTGYSRFGEDYANNDNDREEIESIQEDLEYEGVSNNSMLMNDGHKVMKTGGADLVGKLGKIKPHTNERKDYKGLFDEEKRTRRDIPLYDFQESMPHIHDNEETAKQKHELGKEINHLESHMKNLFKNVRPFSPPFLQGNQQGKRSPRTSEAMDMKMRETFSNQEGKMVEVVYDPVWNCYYDPKTDVYYEIKN
jgi:hypothetical protein